MKEQTSIIAGFGNVALARVERGIEDRDDRSGQVPERRVFVGRWDNVL